MNEPHITHTYTQVRKPFFDAREREESGQREREEEQQRGERERERLIMPWASVCAIIMGSVGPIYIYI